MATSSLQTKINLIKEKKALYTKRVEDARKKNRPDIEKIWLDEIAVLDEEYKELIANQKESNSENNRSLAPVNTSIQQPSAKDARRLRQLNNQISYIERKIAIHTDRGEQAAVKKQTVLLNELLQERATFTANSPSNTNPSPASNQPLPVSTPRALTSHQQNKLNDIKADIAHADKMITEYQKFKSPKAQHWISRKYQLLSQRDAILKSTHQQTPPPLPTSSGIPSASGSISRNDIEVAQATNKQVRVIDLEITHADKMIREYKKYNSPKANQWIQRKNELLARRSRITGHTSQLSAGAQSANTRKRLSVISLELAHTDKMIREYQKYNSPKANEWIEKRNDLLAEKAQLEGRAAPGGGHTSTNSSTSHANPQATDRNAIKAQITELNSKAKDADTKMRTALRQGNHHLANNYLQKRNQHNDQVKQLTAILTGSTVSNIRPNTDTTNTGTHTPPISTNSGHSSQNTGHGSSSGQESSQQNTSQANALEKSIGNKYLTSRNYSNEHAYLEVIDTLLKQGKYQHLIPARETLYDITHASKLPPAETTINNPYIRDCFKIKVSDVRLEGYTINDTIFDTTFPNDFDRMIDRINQHVGPAPELKHYKHLAHRDAIQLIPADRSITKYNSQFAGAKLKNIIIKNININSKGALQGLFASDGSFENIHMENITVKTNSAHQIAILGLLSGTLDLSSPNGQPIHVNLLPLRLAGGNNIYINSFSRDSSYQYGIVNAGNSNAAIADNRQKMTKRGTYYQDFNMEDFFAALRRSDPNSHILTRIKESAKMAGTLAKVIK